MDASSRRSQKEHAKFLIFQIQNNLGKSRIDEESIIQCKDGSLHFPVLLLAALSPLFQKALDPGDCDHILILPDVEVGEMLLFMKYLLSMNVRKFFAKEDLITISKVMKYFETGFDHMRKYTQPVRIVPAKPVEDGLAEKTSTAKPFKSSLKDRKRELLKKFEQKVLSPSNKENHQEKEVPKDLPCTFCGTEIHPSILSKHIRTHHSDMEHACIECKEMFDSRCDLEEHVQIHINSPWFKTCQDCNLVSLSMYQHLNHRKTHTTAGQEAKKCQHCERTFFKESALKAHEEKHLLGKLNKTYACVQCPKTFGKQSNLTRHIRSHFGIKGFSCDQCNAEFVDSTRLKEHKWIHLDYDKFKCPVSDCQEGFRTRSNLKNHLNKKHKEDAKIPCTLCNRKFSFEYKLRNHMRVHEMEEELKKKERTEETVTEFKDSSVYVCMSCKREFKSIADLGVHCNEYHKPQEPRRKKMKVHQVIKDAVGQPELVDQNTVQIQETVIANQQPACLPVVTLTAGNMPTLELELGPGPFQPDPGFTRDENVHLDAETKKHLQTLDDIRLENLVEENIPNNIRLELFDDLYSTNNVDTRTMMLSENVRIGENGQIIMEVNPKDDGLFLPE